MPYLYVFQHRIKIVFVNDMKSFMGSYIFFSFNIQSKCILLILEPENSIRIECYEWLRTRNAIFFYHAIFSQIKN